MAVNGARGLKVYDFMCGDAEYKQSLADCAPPGIPPFFTVSKSRG